MCGITEDFRKRALKFGLEPPCLFIIAMNEMTKDIQNEVSCYVMFTDDIVLVGENRIKLIAD